MLDLVGISETQIIGYLMQLLNALEMVVSETVPFRVDEPGLKVIILFFSCSAQLRLQFILLINVKMFTTIGIL